MSVTGTRGSAAKVIPLHTPPKPVRKEHVQLDAEARAEVMARIREMDEPGTADYQHLAGQYKVGLRTIERIVTEILTDAPRSPTTNRPLRNPLPDDALTQCAAHRSQKGAWLYYQAKGLYRASYPQFTRQMAQQHGANVVRGACRGIDKMNRTVFMKIPGRPFMQLVTIDLFYVRAPLTLGSRTLDRAVGMLVREDGTDTLTNSHIFEEPPTSAMVASVLGQAFRGRTYHVGSEQQPMFVGGLPDFVFCDNEELFHSEEIDGLLGGLGVRVASSNSFASNENGKQERLHGTLRTKLLSLLPGSSDGPRENDKLMLSEAPVDLQTARDLLNAFVNAHNTGEFLEDKSQLSPLERWHEADPEQNVVRRAKTERIAHLAFKHPTTCKRYKLGVRLLNEHYYNDKLPDAPGSRFVVRRWFGDPDHVELFSSDGRTYLGTATRNGTQTAAEVQATKRKRAEDKDTVRAATAAAQPVRAALLKKRARNHSSQPGPPRPGPEQSAAPRPQDNAKDLGEDLAPENPPDTDGAAAYESSDEPSDGRHRIPTLRELAASLTLPDHPTPTD